MRPRVAVEFDAAIAQQADAKAGASYVTVTRLSDAHELFTVIEAAQAGLLADKRAELDLRLGERREVLP